MTEQAAQAAPAHAETICDALRRVVHANATERVTLGEVVQGFGHRAFGLLMLLLGLPMALPVSAIPGVSTLFGVPLILVAAQLALGWSSPRLPRVLAERGVPRASMARILARAEPWLRKAERVTRPRLPWLSSWLAERLVAALCVVLAAVMALPIVGGNQPPGIAISLFAVGLLERDGIFVLLGIGASIAAFFILSAVVGAFGAAAYLIFTHLFG
jgi:hypothetical protein